MAIVKKRRQPTDLGLLTEDDRKRIREEAESAVFAERKSQAEREFLSRATQEERARFDPNEEEVEVLIDLPAYANCLMVDGVKMFHGDVKIVTVSRAMSLKETMARMWEHEHISGNPNMKNYKPVKESAFSAKTGQTVGPTFVRA